MTNTNPHLSGHNCWNKTPFIFAVLVSVIVLGCAGSTPRFSSGNNGSSSRAPRFTYDQTPEELVAEKSEAKAEDDHHVSTEKMKTEVDRIERSPAAKTTRDKMMEVIMSFMGTPYKIGGTDHSGIDCSGFSMVVFDAAFNVESRIQRSNNLRWEIKLLEMICKLETWFSLERSRTG